MRMLAAAIVLLAASGANAEPTFSALSVHTSGRVDVVQDLKTLALCQQVLCMAKWKMTCKAHDEQERQRAEAAKKRAEEVEKEKAKYRIVHPCVSESVDASDSNDGWSLFQKKVTRWRCPLPDGGSDVYGDKGNFLYSTSGGGYLSIRVDDDISEQVCYRGTSESESTAAPPLDAR